MKVLTERDSFLSNYEVLQHLQNIKRNTIGRLTQMMKNS